MKNRIRPALLAFTLAATGVLGFTSTAEAAFSDCDPGKVCLWGNNDFLWLLEERTAGSTTIVNLNGESNNETDSWANRGTQTGAGFDNAGGSGDCINFTAGQSDNNLAFWNSDEVSAWRTKNAC